MSDRFRRLGVGYRFAPAEVPIELGFTRIHDGSSDFTAEVAIYNRGQATAFVTRHVNLKATTSARGSAKDLLEELRHVNGTPKWDELWREASESVIASHRNGRPSQRVQGEFIRPLPPAWLSQGLLLKNKLNCWLGAASTGKSTLAKAICAYYAAGYRFLDREMEQGVPLYLDWEDDFDDFGRVVHDVCRNLGVDTHNLPLMLHRDMHGYKLRDQLDSLTREIDREHVGLVVLDAVAAAGGSPGEHMSYETIALELEACLGALPPVTVLALDHVTSADHKAGGLLVPLKARGSERKVEFFRNQWSLVQDPKAAEVGRHVVVWTQTKINVAGKEPAFATEIVHREAEISVVLRPMETVVPEQAAATETDKLLAGLADSPGGRTPRELALQLDGKEPSRSRVETVRKLLERSERAYKENGRYFCRQVSSGAVLIPFPGSSA